MHTSTVNRVTVWILMILAILANAAGYVFNLFNQIAWYDRAAHFFTMFALTLLVALLLYGVVLTGKGKHTLLLVLTVALVGLGIGAVWEVAEWVYDQWFAQGNAIKGKYDTVIDLIVDTAGTLLAGLVAVMMARDTAS